MLGYVAVEYGGGVSLDYLQPILIETSTKG